MPHYRFRFQDPVLRLQAIKARWAKMGAPAKRRDRSDERVQHAPRSTRIHLLMPRTIRVYCFPEGPYYGDLFSADPVKCTCPDCLTSWRYELWKANPNGRAFNTNNVQWMTKLLGPSWKRACGIEGRGGWRFWKKFAAKP